MPKIEHDLTRIRERIYNADGSPHKPFMDQKGRTVSKAKSYSRFYQKGHGGLGMGSVKRDRSEDPVAKPGNGLHGGYSTRRGRPSVPVSRPQERRPDGFTPLSLPPSMRTRAGL